MPSELITLEYLYNLAGMAAAVILVVSFLKWGFELAGRGAKLAAWITALVVVAIVYLNQGMLVPGATVTALATLVLMWILNSILVTFVAMKAYEEVVEPLTKKNV
ncbi:MAG: hypothetical protein Q8N20_04110 [Eubacteriales bacterium]|nr:hypothetical protein [Desulforudis sp.]MDP3050517.1 hypothetical protein [Eubacteriales bacterium]MDQ7790223.1 hypothetical protein [Clostridia bacterium]MDZ7610777.1 hypothetical protein [Eubacteriales bacterium]